MLVKGYHLSKYELALLGPRRAFGGMLNRRYVEAELLLKGATPSLTRAGYDFWLLSTLFDDESFSSGGADQRLLYFHLYLALDGKCEDHIG